MVFWLMHDGIGDGDDDSDDTDKKNDGHVIIYLFHNVVENTRC